MCSSASALPMQNPQDTARLFCCARCRAQVVICRRCDRGNRYCGPACAKAARRDSLRAAGRRYQQSRRGRFTHAARQRRYRRSRAKVTHQGSPPIPPTAPLPPESQGPAGRVPSRQDPIGVRCRFCGRLCSGLLRRDFLHRTPRRGSVWFTWPSPAASRRSGGQLTPRRS